MTTRKDWYQQVEDERCIYQRNDEKKVDTIHEVFLLRPGG